MCKEPCPVSIQEKRQLCFKHHIAVWDVLSSCEIQGADDSSIKNPVPNDMGVILKEAPIQSVFTTGTKASDLYHKFCYPQTGMKDIKLPSTSPANCGMSYEKLLEAYLQIITFQSI